ncbi:right-handed parallel beta-helix repeat-containing protein [bacterium]|nr:right-handed parallel beta-helix repeat-containing protein [bacterium]
MSSGVFKTDDGDAKPKRTVNVAEFGAIPNSAADSCLAFNKSIEAARESNASTLRIPHGIYHFYWHSCGQWAPLIYVSNTVVTPLPPKPIALWLRGLTGLVIEGEHSLLLMHGLMTPIAVDHSHSITVRNLAVDFPHPSVVEALVTAAAPDGTSLELQVHRSNNLSVAAGKVVFGSHGEGWTLDGDSTLCQEYDPQEDVTWRRGNPLQDGAEVEEVGDDGQSLRLTFKRKQSQFPQRGHHLWFRDGGRPNAGILTQYSSDVTYQSVVMHFMSGFGIVAQYTRNISLFNVSAETTTESRRYCACQADLLHFSGCAGVINVTGGRFVGSQDDGTNVHGTHLQIVEQPSDRQILVQFMQHESYGFNAFFAGDRVQFTRSDTLESFGTGVVKTAKMLSAKGCAAAKAPETELPCQFALELEKPLVGARLKMDVVENLAWTPDFHISGAYFSRIPTRGLLVTTRGRVRISNNTIHTPLRPALHISDDAASWYESGPTGDVIFDGNIVVRKHNVSASHARLDSSPVDVAPSNTKNATVHRNLRVTNNELHLHRGSSLGVVTAKSIAGIVLSGNSIYSPNRSLTPVEMISTTNCTGIVVKDNTVITTATVH